MATPQPNPAIATATAEQLAQLTALARHPFYRFQPRPDCPEDFDQQTSFLNSRAKVAVAMGGNRSGKTETAAQKTARYVLCHQEPPRPDTPFMVVSDTYSQVGNICWKEKLSRILPPDCVDWGRVSWYSVKEGLPFIVPLRPRRGTGNNWSLEFRSVDQGRRHFQGRSFGGFWFSEQFPFEVFEEVLRGCSDYWFDGGQFAEFTPLDADLSVAIEERMDAQPVGWEFFRLNTLRNKTLAEGFTDAFFSAVSPELLATRQTGAIPTFLGAIYQNFNPAVHVISSPEEWQKLFGRPAPARYCSEAEMLASFPPNYWFRRGLDWGESTEHPFVALWGAKDGGGNWVIFDEYIEDTGTVLYSERQAEMRLRWPWPAGNVHFGATYADPSRPLLIQEFTRAKIPTIAANNGVDDGIEYVRNLLKTNPLTRRPSLVIYRPHCQRLVKELRKYRWVRGVDSGRNPHSTARPTPLKWQDDAPDALRYLVYSDRGRGGSRPHSAAPQAATPNQFGVLLERR